jgi:hypothetical protein
MTDGETHYNHGVALQMQRNFAESARAYQRALLSPDLLAAHFNLGVLFQEQRMTDAAVAAYGEVLAAEPGNVAAYRNLGEVLLAPDGSTPSRELRRFEALPGRARSPCRRSSPASTGRLCEARPLSRRAAARPLRRARRGGGVDALRSSSTCCSISTSSLRGSCISHNATTKLRADLWRAAAAADPPAGAVRIGYLSADLRNHVMGKMIWSAVRHHDKVRFELFFYSLSAANDEWTQNFRGLADSFEVIAQFDERAAASAVAATTSAFSSTSPRTRRARSGILA